MATKSPDAFRTISEVAEWLETPAHVLRFWESKFAQVKPVKRAGGRRYYRPSDMALIGGIKTLLHDEGMTIKGVQKLLREQGVKHVASFSPPLNGQEAEEAPAPAAEDARVVPFQARGGPRRPSGPVEDAEELPLAPADDDVAESAESAGAPPAPAEEPPAPAAPHDQGVPSFLRPGGPAIEPDAPRPEAEAPATEAAPEPSIRPVSTPPDPADDALPAAPGPLSRLARLKRLSPGQAAAMTAVAGDLRALAGRRAAASRPDP